jgi:hypothetical protein
MKNWGIAYSTYCTVEKRIHINSLDVIQPVLPTGKQVRRNSKDLAAAEQLAEKAYRATKGAQVIFVEVPSGSQSARASAGYGMCVGVLATLRMGGVNFFELTPTEVKLAGAGIKTASKKQMIAWGREAHPEAVWPTYTKNGEVLITESKAEHMADAIATIHAGVQLDSFRQFIQMSSKLSSVN